MKSPVRSVRITDALWARLCEEAKKAGLSPSEWVRQLVANAFASEEADHGVEPAD